MKHVAEDIFLFQQNNFFTHSVLAAGTKDIDKIFHSQGYIAYGTGLYDGMVSLS